MTDGSVVEVRVVSYSGTAFLLVADQQTFTLHGSRVRAVLFGGETEIPKTDKSAVFLTDGSSIPIAKLRSFDGAKFTFELAGGQMTFDATAVRAIVLRF